MIAEVTTPDASHRGTAAEARTVYALLDAEVGLRHGGFVLELGRNRFEGTGRELLDNLRQHYLDG